MTHYQFDVGFIVIYNGVLVLEFNALTGFEFLLVKINAFLEYFFRFIVNVLLIDYEI